MIKGLTKQFFGWACIPAVLCVIALWYQFGFTLGGMIEEWDFLWMMNAIPHFWNSFPGSPMSDQFAARPLQVLPFAIARAMDGHSFIGFHFVLMIACFVRIVAGASIGFFLFRSRTYAIALGLLFLVFPADTQQMTFRTLNISVSIGLMLLGGALALRGIVATSKARRTISAVLSGMASVIAVLIYEPVITLYALPILLIFGRYGLRKTLLVGRRRKSIIGLWAIAPVINAAYLAYALIVLKSGYQMSVSQHGMLRSIIENRRYLWKSAAYRSFYEAWTSTLDILLHQTAKYGFLVIVAVVALLVLLSVSGRARNDATASRFARYVVVGLLALIAGYSPFMVSEGHMNVTQRTFMAAAPGASIVVMAAIAFACRKKDVAGALVAAVFVFIGLVAQLYQFDTYIRLYVSVTRPYMSMMADMMNTGKPIHLVHDTSGIGGYFNGMYISKIRAGASDRLGLTTGASALCLDSPASPFMTRASCKLENGVWTVDSIDGVSKYPAKDVQVMEIGDNFNQDYRSTHGGWNDRASFTTAQSIFKPDAADQTRYTCNADSDWGYTRFCRGERWSNGMHRMDDDKNYFLAIAPNPTLQFDLKPTGKTYQLSIQTLGIDLYAAKNLEISVNGTPVKWSIQRDFFIQADVPSGAMKNGLNKIEFQQAIAPGTAAGLPITKISLGERAE
jgi:hypothetical protein